MGRVGKAGVMENRRRRRRRLGPTKDEEPGEENKSRLSACIFAACPPAFVLFMPACLSYHHMWIQASQFKNISLAVIKGAGLEETTAECSVKGEKK